MAFSTPVSKSQSAAPRYVDAHLDWLKERLKKKRGVREIRREIDFVESTFTQRGGIFKQFADMSVRFCNIMDVNGLTHDEKWTKISILCEDHLHSVRSLVERKDLEFSISYFDHEDYMAGIETMLEKIRRYIDRCEINQYNASRPRPSRRRHIPRPAETICEADNIIELNDYLPAVIPPSTTSALPAPALPVMVSRPAPIHEADELKLNNPIIAPQAQQYQDPQSQQYQAPQPTSAPQATQPKQMSIGQRKYIIDLINRSHKSTVDYAYKSINKTPDELDSLSSQQASALIDSLNGQSPPNNHQHQYSPQSHKTPDEEVLRTYVSRGGVPINGYNGHIFAELHEYIQLPSHDQIIDDIVNYHDDISSLTFAEWAYKMYAPDRSLEADDQHRRQNIKSILQRTREQLDANRLRQYEAEYCSSILQEHQEQQVITQEMRDRVEMGAMVPLSSILPSMIDSLP